MRIIKQSHKILSLTQHIHWKDPIKFLEFCGRTCYASQDKAKPGSAPRLVKALIKSGHHSVLEHVNISVRFTTDRGVTHELVRHRLCAFSQESTRYNKDQDLRFILPVWMEDLKEKFLHKDITMKGIKSLLFYIPKEHYIWVRAMADAESKYKGLIQKYGWSPEKARSVLPNSLKTEIIVTANVREWRHILSLRAVGTTGRPHPQMKALMIPLLEELNKKMPVLFEDLYKEYLERKIKEISSDSPQREEAVEENPS